MDEMKSISRRLQKCHPHQAGELVIVKISAFSPPERSSFFPPLFFLLFFFFLSSLFLSFFLSFGFHIILCLIFYRGWLTNDLWESTKGVEAGESGYIYCRLMNSLLENDSTASVLISHYYYYYYYDYYLNLIFFFSSLQISLDSCESHTVEVDISSVYSLKRFTSSPPFAFTFISPLFTFLTFFFFFYSQRISKECIANPLRPLKDFITGKVQEVVAEYLKKEGVQQKLPSEGLNVRERMRVRE